MEIFYEGWGIAQQFITADARVPNEVSLPRPAHRQLARELEDRREISVVDVVEALRPLAQPELLAADAREAVVRTDTDIATGAVVVPLPRRA